MNIHNNINTHINVNLTRTTHNRNKTRQATAATGQSLLQEIAAAQMFAGAGNTGGGVPGWCRCPEWSVQGSSNPRQHDPRLQTFTRLRSLEAGSVLGKQGRRAALRSGRLSDNLGTPRYAKPDYSSNPDINGFDFSISRRGGCLASRPKTRLANHFH